MGVIASVTPCTNPIVTPMCNAMFALKGGNAIIVAPHPRAKKCAKYVVDLFREAIEKLGAPKKFDTNYRRAIYRFNFRTYEPSRCSNSYRWYGHG